MIKKPRGTVDIVNEYNDDFQFVKTTLENLSLIYNYKKIETPIFEEYGLFCRNKNDSSDMVNKEMYVFTDKGDRQMALRPEGTAPVVRSVIEEKLLDKLPRPLKYYYLSPMFRYERPQSGRQRQFHQYGIELIDNNNISNEIQAIELSLDILKRLDINKYVLKINYIGNFDSRKKWTESLKMYFSRFKEQLSEDSVNRIDINPLRILDDKVDGEKDFVKEAPKILDFLTEEEKDEIQLFKTLLEKCNINYEYDSSLVRGLDYYTGFVFEIVSTSEKLKGQSTLIGGGRYSRLFTELGYKTDIQCFGFAAGVERLLIAFRDESNINTSNSIDVYLSNLIDDHSLALSILSTLRKNNISCDCNFQLNKIDKHFKYSEKSNPKYVIILGEKEFKEGNITIKNQATLKQENIKISEIVNYIKMEK